MAKITENTLRKSLKKQLEAQGKVGNVYDDMVDNYIYLWKMKKQLEEDIDEKGLRYVAVNGNGVETEKANESVVNLHKTVGMMLKVLADLKLKDPIPSKDDELSGYV